MTKDPLFFITEPSANISANIANTASLPINPVSFVLNTLLVIGLIYLSIYILKHVLKVKPSNHSYLLKEISINNSLKILFIKIGKKLYLLANNSSQMILLDTIKDQKEILSILTKEEEHSAQKAINLLGFFNKRKKKTKIDTKFESTLKDIIDNSNKLEDLNKK